MDLLRRFVAGGCFRDPGHQGIKVEIDSGGEDVFAANPKGSAAPEHLVIMVNGIIGRYIIFPILVCGTFLFFSIYLIMCKNIVKL